MNKNLQMTFNFNWRQLLWGSFDKRKVKTKVTYG